METTEALTQRRGRGDDEGMELIECACSCLDCASSLDEQHAQGLAFAGATRPAKPFVGEQATSGKRCVEVVVLASPSLPTPRTLALVHRRPSSAQEAGEA